MFGSLPTQEARKRLALDCRATRANQPISEGIFAFVSDLVCCTNPLGRALGTPYLIENNESISRHG